MSRRVGDVRGPGVRDWRLAWLVQPHPHGPCRCPGPPPRRRRAQPSPSHPRDAVLPSRPLAGPQPAPCGPRIHATPLLRFSGGHLTSMTGPPPGSRPCNLLAPAHAGRCVCVWRGGSASPGVARGLLVQVPPGPAPPTSPLAIRLCPAPPTSLAAPFASASPSPLALLLHSPLPRPPH